MIAISLASFFLNNHPPFFNQVAQRYGKVLMELPRECRAELKNFVQWAKAHPLRWTILHNKALTRTEHRLLIEAFFSSMICRPDTIVALKGIVALHRLPDLPLILAYVDMKSSQKTHLYMTHADKLSFKTIMHLEQSFKKQLGTEVDIHFKRDPALIEGYILFIDYKMLDASLSSFLSHLKKKVAHVLS